jgi:protein-tyrosine phosphatase
MLEREAPELRVEVDSAGTADYHVGDPPDSRSQRAALRRGIDLSDARARRVTTEDFARFDLILAMDRDNLRELEALRPKHSRARVQLFLGYAPELGRLEVPDPYYRDASGFEEVLDLAAAASRGLVAALQNVAKQPVKGGGERDRNGQRKHPGHQ